MGYNKTIGSRSEAIKYFREFDFTSQFKYILTLADLMDFLQNMSEPKSTISTTELYKAFGDNPEFGLRLRKNLNDEPFEEKLRLFAKVLCYANSPNTSKAEPIFESMKFLYENDVIPLPSLILSESEYKKYLEAEIEVDIPDCFIKVKELFRIASALEKGDKKPYIYYLLKVLPGEGFYSRFANFMGLLRYSVTHREEFEKIIAQDPNHKEESKEFFVKITPNQ